MKQFTIADDGGFNKFKGLIKRLREFYAVRAGRVCLYKFNYTDQSVFIQLLLWWMQECKHIKFNMRNKKKKVKSLVASNRQLKNFFFLNFLLTKSPVRPKRCVYLGITCQPRLTFIRLLARVNWPFKYPEHTAHSVASSSVNALVVALFTTSIKAAK